MPSPRFDRLVPAKRERLLDAAAHEFAVHGYAGASINRILEQAGMSKGAAYYYVADKADLFAVTLQYCAARLDLLPQALDPAGLTVEMFWPTFARLRREPLLRAHDAPWLFGALKAAGRLDPEQVSEGPLAALSGELHAGVMALVRQGQRLGLVRADVPEELIFQWLRALDSASDDWLLVHWAQMTPETLARLSDMTVQAMRQAVAPPWPDA